MGIRTGIWLAVAGGCLGLGVRMAPPRQSTPERWFSPGPLGRERADIGARRMETGDRTPGRPPSASNQTPPANDRSPSRQGFLTRGMSGVDAGWAARNGITERFAFSHHLAAVFPPSLYAEHPEFFPWVDGRRLRPAAGSGTWNPDLGREDVARYAAGAARKYFEANPGAVSFALGVNDALVWGESPELLALTGRQLPPLGSPARRTSGWFRERPDYSNLVFTFMNRAAAELAKTHPDRYLGALAYYWAENAPDFPLHPQVVPFLTADRAQGYDPAFKREELELQARWGRLAGGRMPEARRQTTDDGGERRDGQLEDLGNLGSQREIFPNRASAVSRVSSLPLPQRLGLYDYLYGGGFLIPRIHPRLLAENLRHARRAGFTDYYAEAYANWGLDGPMPWLAAQLLQDPEQPFEPLLDEYYARYFREAAGPMRKFFERCEELWMAQPGPPYWLKHYRNQSQAIIFPAVARRELRTLLDEAKRQAWFGRTRARVERVSGAFGVTERFAVFYETRDRLTRMALADASEAAGSALALTGGLESYLEARMEFIRFTAAVQRTDPFAVRSFGWDDYLKDDPVPLALFAIHRARSAGSAVGSPLVGGPPNRNETHSRKGPATSRFDTLTAGQQVLQAPSSSQGAGPAILDEPNVAALWQAISGETGDQTGEPGLRNSGIPASGLRSPAPTLRSSDLRPPASGVAQLLRNASMTGSVTAPRTIAGLTYSVALPAEWQSKVEPAQFHRAELVDEGVERFLRVSGTKDTTVSQWAPMPGAVGAERSSFQQATISVRGRVSPGTIVQLVFSWLDAKQRHVGFQTVRLPDGDWPTWVTLRQAGLAPAGAQWVGLGLRVQNQVEGDWVEAKEFGVWGSGF